MQDAKDKLKDLVQQLETERDELKLKLGLAKLEAREEWEELEKKMDTVRGRVNVIGGEAKEASEDVASAVSMLAEEIKDGFARIRELL